jgi:hypothetical protein
VNNSDAIGLMAGRVRPRQMFFEVQDGSYVFGYTGASIQENECKCKCRFGSYYLRCKLFIGYTIYLLPADRSEWKTSLPKSYPSRPVPADYMSWTVKQKRNFVEGHERKHVNAYKKWFTERSRVVESLYESKANNTEAECIALGKIVEKENEEQWFDLYMVKENNHENW